MEPWYLRYFTTVSSEGSFSRAARKLNMAQPPLSRRRLQRLHFDDEMIRRRVLREERLWLAVPLDHRLGGGEERPKLVDTAAETLIIYPKSPRPLRRPGPRLLPDGGRAADLDRRGARTPDRARRTSALAGVGML